MFDLILNLAYTAVIMTFGVTLSKPIAPTELHGVTPVEAKPITSFFSAERHCRFTGVAVPYERDWEIVSENTMTHTKTVIPAALGKIHEYAIILNKKTCPGREPERLFVSGSGSTAVWKNIGLLEGRKIMVSTIGKAPEDQPRWLPQVMKVVEAAEPTQPFVKDFLEYSRAGASEAKPTPAPEVAAQADASAAEPGEATSAQ